MLLKTDKENCTTIKGVKLLNSLVVSTGCEKKPRTKRDQPVLLAFVHFAGRLAVPAILPFG